VAKKSQKEESWEETFDARRLLAVPLVALAIYCTYLAIQNIGGLSIITQSPLELFIFLPLPALLVLVFSGLATYMLIKEKPIGKLATIIAWIFIVLIGWLALAELAHTFPDGNPAKCEGLFGTMQSCANVGYFQAIVFLANPISLGIYSLLSMFGIIALAVRLK